MEEEEISSSSLLRAHTRVERGESRDGKVSVSRDKERERMEEAFPPASPRDGISVARERARGREGESEGGRRRKKRRKEKQVSLRDGNFPSREREREKESERERERERKGEKRIREKKGRKEREGVADEILRLRKSLEMGGEERRQ